MKRVAVVMGGTSHEAEISLRSGAAVVEALQEAGYDVVPVKLTENTIDAVPRDVEGVFIALHGGYGEGGGIQHDFDKAGIPYTGPGAIASALAMDKIATKKVLLAHQIPTPAFVELTVADADGAPKIALPCVIKPPSDGSSVGIFRVDTPDQWHDAVIAACKEDPQGVALAEAYIPGHEWTVSVVDGQALPLIEIRAPGGWYDYHAKYTPGTTEYVFIPETELTCKAQRLAEQTLKVMACRGCSRVDFRVTPEGEIYVLEVNTIPGCTATSLLPKAGRQAGIPFPELCSRIMRTAQCDA